MRNAEQAPAATAGGWNGRSLYALALLLAASVLAYTDRYILPLLQELIKPELKLSDAQLGLAAGPAFALCYALSGLPIARLAERFDRVRLLGGAVAFWSAATAACGAVLGLPTLLAARLCVGIGEGGGVPVSHSLLSDHFPARQRGKAMAILSTGAPISGVLMPLVGGYIAHVWGWRFAFVFIGILGAGLSVLIATTLRDPRRTGEAPRREVATLGADLGWLVRSGAFAWLFVAGALMGIGQAGFHVFLPSFIMRVHHMTLVEASGALSLTGLAGLAGTFAGGWLADRFAGRTGRSYPLTCALSGLATGLLYWLAIHQQRWDFALPLLIGGAFASDLKTGPNYAAIQNLVPPRMRATAAAVFMIAATLVGSGIGPALAGFISDRFAGAAFPHVLGLFPAVCPGGRAVAGAPTAVAQACIAASSAGLRSALAVVALAYVASSVAFALCSRHYRNHAENG